MIWKIKCHTGRGAEKSTNFSEMHYLMALQMQIFVWRHFRCTWWKVWSTRRRIVSPVGHGDGDDTDDEREDADQGRHPAERGLRRTRGLGLRGTWMLLPVHHVPGMSHYLDLKQISRQISVKDVLWNCCCLVSCRSCCCCCRGPGCCCSLFCSWKTNCLYFDLKNGSIIFRIHVNKSTV